MATNNSRQSKGKLDMQKIYAKYNVSPHQKTNENDNIVKSKENAAKLETASPPHTSASPTQTSSPNSSDMLKLQIGDKVNIEIKKGTNSIINIKKLL